MQGQDSTSSAGNRNKSLLSLLVSLLVAGLLVVAGIFIYNNTRLYIKSTLPKNNSVIPTSTPYIDFVFNKELDEDSVKSGVSSTNSNILQRLAVSGSNLRIYLATLNVQFGASYTILFENIRSTDDKTLEEFTYEFISEYIPFEDQSKQSQQTAIDDVDRNLGSLDVVYEVLPYINRASNYYVDVEEGDGDSIRIIIKPLAGTLPVSKTNVDEAKDYLFKRGIDISAYTIVVD